MEFSSLEQGTGHPTPLKGFLHGHHLQLTVRPCLESPHWNPVATSHPEESEPPGLLGVCLTSVQVYVDVHGAIVQQRDRGSVRVRRHPGVLAGSGTPGPEDLAASLIVELMGYKHPWVSPLSDSGLAVVFALDDLMTLAAHRRVRHAGTLAVRARRCLPAPTTP
nr:hypothetical protein [Blastococcus sp. MG754426]